MDSILTSPFNLSIIHQTESIILDDETTRESLDAKIIIKESTLVIDDGVELTIGEGKTLIPDLYDLRRQPQYFINN